MKQIRTLKTLLLLMALTAGNAYADTYARYASGVEYKNMTFDLYVWYKEYGSASYYSLDDSSHPPYATLTGISGTSEEVVVPYSFGYGDHAFEVKYVTQTVSNNYVKKLTFRNNVSFIHQFLYYTISETGNLACPALEELVFECGVQLRDALQCPSLKDIYFKGSKPSFNGVWSKYFSVPTGQVTAHVAELTAEECDSLHENVIPWVDFKEVVPYSEIQETVDVTVTVSNGGRVRANNLGEVSNNSTKTIQLNKHSTFTFFSFANLNYEVGHVYVNGRDVYGTDELEWIESSSSWRYRLEDVTQEAYINVVGEATNLYANVSSTADGTVAWDSFAITNGSSIATLPKAGGTEFTLTPKPGYELDKCWLRGFDVTTQYPGCLVSNADGTYTFTLPALDVDETTLAVTFKKASSPNLKITMVNGSGGKMALGLTYNGQPAAQRWIEGGDAFSISTLQKEKLGDEFTLTAIMEPGRKNAGVRINGYVCPIASSSGDTLFYNLGNLKAHGDSVVITSLYQDLADFSKSRIHIKSKGTPGNLTRWALRDVTKKKDVFNVAVSDVPTLDRIDTLDVNTQYNFAFYGSTDNVKRVLINGEEVTLSTGSIKRTPNRILRSFDDEIFIELEGTVHAAYSMNDGGNTCMRAYYEGELISYARSEATEVNLDGADANKPITLWLTPNEGFTVQLLLNGRNIPLADATTPEESIPGNYMVKNDGGYEFVLPAEFNTGGSEARFNIIYKKISFFDVNGDGEINVSDVTALVNKILHP